ncbi:MAG TPA: M56 family metallopeptidase [Gemmatales bacterium]|nr:M56 family metallopeptidase [Gemmatales bacterium]
MNQFFSNELLQRCGELALQVTLWVTLGMSLLILLRKQSPRLLKQLGIAIMFGMVVLTIANLIVAPWWHIGSWFTASKPMISDSTSIVIPSASDTNNASASYWPLSFGAQSNAVHHASITPLAVELTQHWPWKEWLILACAGLSALLFLRLAIGLWQLHRLRQQAWVVRDEKLHHFMAALKRHFEVSGKVEVRELATLPGPLTFGYRRPVILLPGSWRTWTEKELRCVLAHELGHISARDFLTYLLMQITRALHGYHPLVHWLYWRVASLLEIQTDVAAARCVGQELYIRAVCELVLKLPNDERSRMIAPSLGFGPLVPLSRRMSMLTLPPWSRPSKWLITALALVLPAALVLLLGLRTPTQADDTPGTKQPDNAKVAQPVNCPPYVLDYLPTDTKTVLCLRPTQMAALPGNYLMPKFNADVDRFLSQFEFSLPLLRLQEIEQVVALGETSLSLVKLIPGKSWQEIFAKDQPALKPTKHAGKTMYVLNKEALKLGAIVEALGLVDEQTLIFGTRAFVETCLEGKHQKPAFRWSAADWKTMEHAWVVVAMDLQDMVAKARIQQEPFRDQESVKKMIEASKSADYVFMACYPGEQVDFRMSALRVPGKLHFNDAVDDWCREFFRRTVQNINGPGKRKLTMSEPVCDTVRAAGQSIEVDRVVYRLKNTISYSDYFAVISAEEKILKQEMKDDAEKNARQAELAHALKFEIPDGWIPLDAGIEKWMKEKNTPFYETNIKQFTMPGDLAETLRVPLEPGKKLASIDRLQLFELLESVQGDVRAYVFAHPRILHPGQFSYAGMLPLYDLNGLSTQEIKPSSLTMHVNTKGSDWHSECDFSQKVSEQVTNHFKVTKTTTGENILLLTQRYEHRGKPWVMVTAIETKDADHIIVKDPQPRMMLKSWHFHANPQMVEKLKIAWKAGMNSANEMATLSEAAFFDTIRELQEDKHFTMLTSPMVISKFEDKSQVEHGKLWKDVGAIRQQVWGKLMNDRIRLNGEVLTMLDSDEKIDGKSKLTGFPVQFESQVKPGECLLIRWTDEKGLCRVVAFCPKAIVQLGNKQPKE